MIKIDLNDLDKFFVKGELIPAICYEVNTKTVLMLAYMNRESLQKTFETGYTWFWSRSRQELWNKGATSGHLQKVVELYADCDDDTLLVVVEQTGAACHTGNHSCFLLAALYATVENRRDNPKEGSYTCYLLDKGLDKILKKVGEECSETIIAAKNGDNSETVYEIADLIYHLTVMMVQQGIPLEDVLSELDKRSEKTGNLKTFHVVDKNS